MTLTSYDASAIFFNIFYISSQTRLLILLQRATVTARDVSPRRKTCGTAEELREQAPLLGFVPHCSSGGGAGCREL